MAIMANIELTAKFIRERHIFNNNDGSRVIIGDGWNDGKDITIKGEAFQDQLRPGLTYRFYGQWRTHEKHGQQFWFQNFVTEQPADEGAVRAYLKQCRGIGPAVSGAIWREYGEKSVSELRENPRDVARKIPALKVDDALAAADFLKKHQRLEKAKIDLMSILNGKGFPRKIPDQLIRDYGVTAAERIRKSPYLLMRYPGCGFMKADRLYLDLGHCPHRLKRQALCAWHAVNTQGGDTWFGQAVARDAIASSVAGSKIDVARAMDLCRRGHLLVERTSQGARWIADARKANSELRVAMSVASMLETPAGLFSWPSPNSLRGLTDHQFAEVSKSISSRISVLCGSPGTGKTYSAAKVIHLLLERYGADLVAVAAPTGKAAVRISQAMSENEIPLKAQTIHSLLQVESSNDGGFSFVHGQFNPIPQKFVIVDEASMIDTDLMSSLLIACDSSTHVLFIGDTNQLSPVGHGAPLRDLIAAGVPTGTLTKIRRNSGRIVRTCAAIRDYKRFEASEKLDLEAGENLLHIEKPSPRAQIEQLEALMHKLSSDPEQKYDPVWDVQVLVAVNQRSELGRKPLNEKLQNLLNPNGKTLPGNPFRVGDKIINGKNGRYGDVSGEAEHYVANGEQAEVLEIEKTRMIARLTAPDRIIVIPRSAAKRQDPDQETQVGEEKDGQAGTGCNWDLAYAISTHKSQGSEWPIVIVMLDGTAAASRVQSRNWIYTAISRARKFCITIGEEKLAQQIARRDGLRRKTFLAERIQEHLTVPIGAAETEDEEDETEFETDFKFDFGAILEGVI
jgi:exodeoxyribonuclease V alpha subunit